MYSEEEIKQVALAEAQLQTLGVTEQFFAVHKLDEETPIRHIQKDGGKWLVFCGIEDEPYYWVIVIKSENEALSATWAYCNPHSRVYLSICSSDVTPDMITQLLSLNPTRTAWMGKPLPGSAGSKAGRCYKTHQWCYEEDLPSSFDFEDKLNSLLRILIDRKAVLQSLADSSDMCISVPHYIHVDYSWGLHLDQKQIFQLAELKLELDVDLYTSGAELPD